VAAALTQGFPGSAIKTEEGWQGRVHVRIVSERFDGKSEAEKQGMVWEVLRAVLGADAQAVSLVLPYGMDELP
jgi:stress-induced morphogen